MNREIQQRLVWVKLFEVKKYPNPIYIPPSSQWFSRFEYLLRSSNEKKLFSFNGAINLFLF